MDLLYFYFGLFAILFLFPSIPLENRKKGLPRLAAVLSFTLCIGDNLIPNLLPALFLPPTFQHRKRKPQEEAQNTD